MVGFFSEVFQEKLDFCSFLGGILAIFLWRQMWKPNLPLIHIFNKTLDLVLMKANSCCRWTEWVPSFLGRQFIKKYDLEMYCHHPVTPPLNSSVGRGCPLGHHCLLFLLSTIPCSPGAAGPWQLPRTAGTVAMGCPRVVSAGTSKGHVQERSTHLVLSWHLQKRGDRAARPAGHSQGYTWAVTLI